MIRAADVASKRPHIPALSEEQLMISMIDICTVSGICPGTDTEKKRHKHCN